MLQSIWSLLFAAAILPPAGLALLWMRSGMRLKDRVLGSALIAVWAMAYLSLFFGLHFQMDGSGMWPVPTFYNLEAHYEKLEQTRARQATAPIVPVAAPAPAAEPEAATPEKPAEVARGAAYWTDFRGPQRD